VTANGKTSHKTGLRVPAQWKRSELAVSVEDTQASGCFRPAWAASQVHPTAKVLHLDRVEPVPGIDAADPRVRACGLAHTARNTLFEVPRARYLFVYVRLIPQSSRTWRRWRAGSSSPSRRSA
jgi:hypothetical protein